MTDFDQAFVPEVREQSDDEGQEEDGLLKIGDEPDEDERGPFPSHLPFAPSSELPYSTTIDPSYIISLIRKLLPNNIDGQKTSQRVSYSSSPVETSDVCLSQVDVDGKSNYMKKVLDINDIDNTGPHSIANAKYEGSINHHVVDQTYSYTAIYNGMDTDSRKEDTGIDGHETRFFLKENVWENAGCILWDLSASSSHAEFMVDNYLLEVLLATLHSSKSPRIMEICLGILGNLACHGAVSNTMASKDDMIETVVAQLYLDDASCLVETFRLLTVALQGSGSTLWATALLPEEICLRIFWIVGNTLNTMLLEKGIEFLLTVANLKEVTNIHLSWIKRGFPDLVMYLLSSEMANLDDENKLVRTSFIDPVLCLVEALSSSDCGLEMIFQNEELCHFVCRVIKLPDKYEYTSARVISVVIIANFFMDIQHIASQLSQDHEFVLNLLETIPFVSDDPEARHALWWILERLFFQVIEKDIDISTLHHLASIFLEKYGLIVEDLDSHWMEDSSPPNDHCIAAIVKTLLGICSIIGRWLPRKIENIDDAEGKTERLLHYCNKYNSLLSTENV